MNKLFSLEDIDNELESDIRDENSFMLHEDTEDTLNSLELSIESFRSASNYIDLVTNISSTLNNEDKTSMKYFTSLENFTHILETITLNLGIKSHIPSLEDFKNPYGTEASHNIAIESFGNIIKKLWEKIKSVFMAFFKKVNLFIRRLLGYNLELQDYEKYVEHMVAKIKSKKLVIKDSTVLLDSKLPSLLAAPGMNKVNSDYILTAGDTKANRLSDLVSRILTNNLKEISNKDFKIIYEEIVNILNIDFNEGIDESDVITKIASVKARALAALSYIYTHSNINIKSLPEPVYNAIQYQFSREEISDQLTISSLVYEGDNLYALPKHFNSYFINYDNSKVFISSSVEPNTYVENKVNPISNPDNLAMFYDSYKKFSKDVDIRKLDSSIDSMENSINKIIDLMRTRFSNLLEVLTSNKIENNSSASRLFSAISVLQNVLAHFENVDLDTYIAITAKLDERLGDYGVQFRYLTDSYQNRSETVIKEIRDTFKGKEELFIVTIEDILNTTITGNESNIGDSRRKALAKILEDFQKFMLNYLNSIQTMLKTLSAELAGMYIELKYELIKYIYDSCKLYNV